MSEQTNPADSWPSQLSNSINRIHHILISLTELDQRVQLLLQTKEIDPTDLPPKDTLINILSTSLNDTELTELQHLIKDSSLPTPDTKGLTGEEIFWEKLYRFIHDLGKNRN